MENKQKEITQKLMDAFLRFRRLHPESPVPGMKHSEIRLLFMIKWHMGEAGSRVKFSKLIRSMRVTSPTVTQLMNGLEAAGLVERSMDPGDRRSIYVILTKRGETVLQQAGEAFFARFNSLVNHLGEDRSELLVELLTISFDFMNGYPENSHSGEQE